MTSYSPSRAYEPQLDVRFTGGVDPPWAVPVIEGRPPNSQCWLVVVPRRGGKSWFAAAVRRSRERAEAGTTDIVDLRGSALTAKRARVYSVLMGSGKKMQLPPRDGILIIDEPGPAVQGDNAAKFAAGLVRIREAGALPVVLLTPGEQQMLVPHLETDAEKDVIFPPGLLRVEANRMAERAPQWGPVVVDEIGQIDPQWLRSPFLLELLLHVAEQQPALRADVPRLLRTAMGVANSTYQYLEQLLKNGLTGQQRADLRAVRWRDAGIDMSAAADTLVRRTTIPNDPVVEGHLPEVLRIHHISDLHHGGTLRANVDAKDKSLAGRHLAQLAGAGTPLDSYLAHVTQLASRNQAPHIVLVTGDVVNRPDDASGETARAWLQKLHDLLAPHPDLAPGDPRIVLVGGNHDVSWDLCLDPDRHARHTWFATAFAGYPHADLHLPAGAARRLEVRYPAAGLRLLLLGSAESGGEAVSDEDAKLVQEFEAKLATEADEFAIRELVHKLERIDPGIVSRAILDRVTPEPGMLTFAALHHPVSPVPAVEVAPYSGIVNAGQAKRVLATARTALVLHGHTHMAFFAAERILNAAPNWTMRIAGAASLAAATSDEQNGYNQVLVAREGGAHTVLIRPMRLDGGQWTAQESFAFRPGDSDESPLDRLGLDIAAAGAHRG
jgi:hypothetical protein